MTREKLRLSECARELGGLLQFPAIAVMPTLRRVRLVGASAGKRKRGRVRKILLAAAAWALATLLAAGAAFAQSTTPEVVVTSHKAMEKVGSTGTSSSGIPIVDVSLSYTISTAGLDLASQNGAAELEKRVRTAAMDACKELSGRYKIGTPSDSECAKVAIDKAMAKVRQLETAAAKK